MKQCTLFLDFASSKKSIGLVDGKKTLALEPLDDHTDEANLLPTIERMLKGVAKDYPFGPEKPSGPSNGKLQTTNYTLINRIAATTGPGGFMSLRVGIALANALAWSLKVPLAGIHLSDLWSARVPSPPSPLPMGEGCPPRGGRGEGYLWLHSTKRDAIFVRGFGTLESFVSREASLVPREASRAQAILMTAEDVGRALKKAKKTVPYVGELIEEHRKLFPMLSEERSLKPVEEILPSVIGHLNFSSEKLLPWYGRGG